MQSEAWLQAGGALARCLFAVCEKAARRSLQAYYFARWFGESLGRALDTSEDIAHRARERCRAMVQTNETLQAQISRLRGIVSQRNHLISKLDGLVQHSLAADEDGVVKT